MIKGIIFPTEEHAKQADWQHNHLTGSASKYHFARKALNTTTTLTKAQYAQLFGIPTNLVDDDGTETANPKYTDLESSYTLDKYASIVGDSLDYYDEDGNFVNYSSPYDRTLVFPVVDVSNMLKTIVEE